MKKDRKVDHFKAIRVLAAHAVKEQDQEYLERFIMRWYSKTFFTPYLEVQEIPLEDIYQHFFEEYYEGLDEEELVTEIAKLIETDEEHMERLKLEAAEELAAQQLIKASEMQNSSLPAIEKGKPAPLPTGTDKLGAIMPESIQLPPDVEIEFALDKDFEKLINGLESFAEVMAKAKAEKKKPSAKSKLLEKKKP